MRLLLPLLILLGSIHTYAQELLPEQEAILTLYDLQADDHRGVEFQLASATNPAQYSDIASAIEDYFTTAIKRDYTILTVTTGEVQYLQTPLSILDLVNIYLSLTQINDPSNE